MFRRGGMGGGGRELGMEGSEVGGGAGGGDEVPLYRE